MTLMNLKIDDYAYIKYINIKDNSLKIHLLEIGLVYNTKIRLLYKDSNIVVIKLKDQVSSGVKLANNYTIGETVISISNKAIGYKANKGLLVTDNGYLQSTIPVSISDSGSPLFNTKGEVIGLTTTLLTNSPSSFSIPYLALSEVTDKFTMAFNEIKTIKDLKQFIKDEMYDMDNYPFGFKHIDGVYCLYEAYC